MREGREQLVLDVIHRKNISYLPSVINFSNRKKKMECAAYMGITQEEEFDEYLGNHIRFTATLDDVPSHDWDDKEKVAMAMAAGRAYRDPRDGFLTDLWGMKFDPEGTSYFNYSHPLAEAAEDPQILKNFHAPQLNPRILDKIFAPCEKDKEYYDGKMLVLVSGYNGIWEKTYDMMGMENFMVTLMEEPEIVEQIMDVVTDYKVEIAKETVKRGFKVGHHGDDLGTQISTFFSEEMFVKYFKPRFKRIFDVYHEAGIPVQMHSCGKITPFIPHLIDIGLDILEPCQPVMDIGFLQREYGKDLIFYGGIDTQDLLAFRSSEEVYEETLKIIDILGKDGGYICGPAQEIMNNVPPANVAALVKAIRHSRGEE